MSGASLALGRPLITRDRLVLAAAALVWLAIGLDLARVGAWSSLGLHVIAASLGAVFLITGFGYTGAIRKLIGAGEGAGLAAGLVVALVATAVILPVAGLVEGYGGTVAPIGLPVIGGAALFGVGMQWANGCGSGTLYAAGGGSRRLWVALPFFCAGGLIGSLLLPSALALPSLTGVSLPDLLGVWGGLAATLALTAGLVGWLWRMGPAPRPAQLRAAVLIGLLAAAAFLLSGQPWGITMGLTIWGAKAAAALGADIGHFTFWQWDGPAAALSGSVLDQDSSLMDIGMLLGAAMASAARGGFTAQGWPPARGIVGAALGGLLMGIGARLSYGCNIGAMIGGISVGSLHGFVWLAAVIPGSWLGMQARPWFGLSRI